MPFKLYHSGHVIGYDAKGHSVSNHLTDFDRRKKRRYIFTFKKYIRLLSSMLLCVHQAQHKCIFLTFTFPCAVTERESNKIFSTFIDNMKKTYKLKRYVCIKEFQTKNKIYKNNPHFHGIFDFPFAHILDINRSFCNSVGNYFKVDFSHVTNAVQLPKHPDFSAVVSNPEHIARYLGLYLSKGYKTEYKERFIFMSNCVQDKGYIITPKNENKALDTCYYEKKYQYHTLYQIDSRETLKIIREKL